MLGRALAMEWMSGVNFLEAAIYSLTLYSICTTLLHVTRVPEPPVSRDCSMIRKTASQFCFEQPLLSAGVLPRLTACL